jgi:hypothetical protein
MRKRYTILFLVLICLNIDVIAQVGINTTNPNAALDIEKQLIASKMYGSEEEPETEIDTDADV